MAEPQHGRPTPDSGGVRAEPVQPEMTIGESEQGESSGHSTVAARSVELPQDCGMGGLTRRDLLQSAASFAIPAIVPAGVIGKPGRQGANDRIVIANIGVGGMGSNHIPPDSAALCDVDDNRLAAAAKRVVQGTPALYKDYRRILERKDIDAVTIGTPDHWHALMTVHACQAGKHVYSEKPTCRTLEEGRAMVNAARYYKRVVQIGAQGRSHPNAVAACNYARNTLGRISRVEVWHPDNPTTAETGAPEPVPATLDWDMWLGPARRRPYSHVYHPGAFRWFMEFGGGQIRDRGNHALSIVSWLTNMDDYRGVVTCEATGTPQVTGCYDVPLKMQITWGFRSPDLTVTWSQPGIPKMNGLWGQTYYGDRDSLIVVQGDGACNTEDKAKQYTPPDGGFHAYSHPTTTQDVTARHRENWLDCIRTGKRPIMDVAIGVHVVTLCILANLSWTLNRKISYDYARERFVDDPEADRFISDPMRYPWHL